uniref:Major vault protein n=1 Tax=Gorilla gorilla gorilla TaxID=9595 RepID=A0A2I2ZP64_GORGO
SSASPLTTISMCWTRTATCPVWRLGQRPTSGRTMRGEGLTPGWGPLAHPRTPGVCAICQSGGGGGAPGHPSRRERGHLCAGCQDRKGARCDWKHLHADPGRSPVGEGAASRGGGAAEQGAGPSGRQG